MAATLLRAAALGLLLASAGAAQAAPTLLDGSFESPGTGGYVYNPTATGVTFNAGSGVQRNGSDWGFADAPDGVQTAFIQSSYSYVGQIGFALTDLVIGQAYAIGFSASARPNYASNAFAVTLGNLLLGSYDVTTNGWQSFTTGSFTATATSATLRFTGSATTNGDNDVGLDRVAIAAVPEPASWAMMVAGFGAVGFALRRRRTPAGVAALG